MKPTIICLTPMKNEGWIIQRFLRCTSTWADYIVVFDQNSEDDSVKKAKEFEKVTVIHNQNVEFNDHFHWKELLETGRKLPGENKVFFAIDCDEFFTSESFDSPEFQTFIHSKPGSLMACMRSQVSPDFETYSEEVNFVVGFVDDGKSSIGDLSIKKLVHNIRLPFRSDDPTIYYCNEIKLMHYNVVDYKRLLSKLRWYQCFETTIKDKGRLEILEQYYVPDTFQAYWRERKTKPMPSNWLDGYKRLGIDMTSISSNSVYYWWDEKILNYFSEYGTEMFSRLNIWNFNWNHVATHFRNDKWIKADFKRSVLDKIYIRLFLIRKRTKSSLLIRGVDIFLSIL